MTMVVYRINFKLSKEKIEKETALKKMQYLATHDNLTHLPNRFLFMELLDKMVHDAKRREAMIAVMFLDLDNFKQVNDNFGHNMGDKILCKVAKILSDSLRLNDIAARLGGDEFIFAFSDVKEVEDLNTLTQRIIKNISGIELPSEISIDLGASIGVIYGKMPHNNTEYLIQLSDQLMYEAKQAGKGAAILKDFSTLNSELKE